MDRDSLVIAVRLLYEEAYLKHDETDQPLYLGEAVAYSRVLDLLSTTNAVENLKQNNKRIIAIIENRLADLKREFSVCKTQIEIYEFERNHLAIKELENLLITLKGLK